MQLSPSIITYVPALVYRCVLEMSTSAAPVPIRAVPQLVWRRNEAIVMAEVQLQPTPHRKATWRTSYLQTVAHVAHFELLGQG